MRKNGQITVFLSMILVCVFGLLCGILESVRTAGTRCYLQSAVNSSAQSVFSQYHRKLWEKYRILGVLCREESLLNEEMIKFLEPYGKVSVFYPMKINNVKTLEALSLTDGEGRQFEKEILDYMKYGVWNFEIKTEAALDLFDHMREALVAQEVSDSWRKHMLEITNLEHTLEAIRNCIGKQKEHAGIARESLDRCDGPEFRKHAHGLAGELRKIPGLVETYRKQIEKLTQVLEESRKRMEVNLPDLSTSVRVACEQELSGYETYVGENELRRKEVETLQACSEKAETLTERMVSAALEAEDYIKVWEPDDEDDVLDEEVVWEPVRNYFSGLNLPGLSCKMGLKDTESKGILDRIGTMLNLDILELLLPEGVRLSNGVLPLTSCPSRQSKQDGQGSSSFKDRIIVDEYSSRVFSNFLSNEKKNIQYEMEYLIAGKNSDRDNLNAVVKQLILIREGANLFYLLTDSKKRGEAQALAAAIVGAVGLAPLVPVVMCFILSIWALGETLTDLSALLRGEKVPLLKTEGNWNLSLQDLWNMGIKRKVKARDVSGDGLTYMGYLKLLLFAMEPIRKRFRMMDVMQINISKEQPRFRIRDCLVYVDMEATVCGKHVFLALPLLKTLGYSDEIRYGIKVRTQKSY